MIPRNIFFIEEQLHKLTKKLLCPGLDESTARKIKDKIKYREAILKKLRQQLEIDIMDM